MELDRERTQLILLRILGVLLIVVGFTMIARSSESATGIDLRISERLGLLPPDFETRCRRSVRVEVHESPKEPFLFVAPPEAPPPPPAPPVLHFAY